MHASMFLVFVLVAYIEDALCHSEYLKAKHQKSHQHCPLTCFKMNTNHVKALTTQTKGGLWGILEKLPIPPIATLIIAGVIMAIILILVVCCCGKLCCRLSRCCKQSLEGNMDDNVDLSELQLLGATTFERVYATSDELDHNLSDEEEEEGIKLGKVKFGLVYDFEEQALKITIFEARDLPSADEDGTSDPYVRVYLLPDLKRRYETTVLDSTLNPVYNQEFTFANLPYSEVTNRTLCIRVLDYDQMPGHDILGEALLPMIDINLYKPVEEEWRILVPGYEDDGSGEFRKAVSEYGDICISVRYVPVTKRLSVYLLECKNLKSTDVGALSDPFVRITVYINKKRVKRRKSRVIKQSLDPYYNEQYHFKISPADIELTTVECLVMDYDLIGAADVIGQVKIGAFTYGPQLRQWCDMLKFPRRPCAQWHMLRAKPKKGEED